MFEKIGIGSFLLTEKEVIISDPCYETQRHDLQGRVENAKTGEWVACVIESNSRVAELVATHKDFQDVVQWEPMLADLPVDSGQMGIFQKSVYRNDSLIPDCMTGGKLYGRPCDGAKFFTACCSLTASWNNGGFRAGVLQEGGCVAQSGYGDGVYCYLVAQDENEAVGIRVVFIDTDY